jgi:hypothetical protein
VVVPYALAPDGRWTAPVPTVCPWRLPDAPSCRVRVDHRRDRKSGPCFALVVARCAVHDRAFTLYPPGHVPYGRVAIAPVAVDGAPLRSEAPDDIEPGWGATVFAAALDASRGEPWTRSSKEPSDPRRWRTQRRRLSLAAALVGIAAIAVPVRAQIAHALDVALLALADAAAQFGAAAGYRGRGDAVLHVLRELRVAPVIGDQLLASGALAGCWGEPMRWEAESGRLRVIAFRASGIPP